MLALRLGFVCLEVSRSLLPFQSLPASQAQKGFSRTGDRVILRCRLLLDHSIPEQGVAVPGHYASMRTMPIRGPGQSTALQATRRSFLRALDKLVEHERESSRRVVLCVASPVLPKECTPSTTARTCIPST
jgi:hypothetical protein